MPESATSERRRIVVRAVVILALVGVGAVGVAISTLYRAAYEAEGALLTDALETRIAGIRSTRRIVEQVGAPLGDSAPDPAAATLAQLAAVQRSAASLGCSCEFVLAQRQGDEIVFMLSQRPGSTLTPDPISWSAELAEPMRRALGGQKGTERAIDYRGVEVLAAYAPIDELGWGVVMKRDVAELQAPYVRAGALAMGLGVVLVVVGAGFIERLVSPILRRIDELNEERVEAETQGRERAEEITRESLSITQSVLGTAVDAIISIDETGTIQSVNGAASTFFGYEVAEMVGQNVSMLMPDPYRSEHDRYLAAYAETGKAKIIGIGREVPCRRKDGSIFPGDLAVSEVKLDGRTLYTGILRDLTERAQNAAQLREAEQRVHAAEELASVGTLVAGLAHEIGTPMGVIQGHAKLLQKHVENEKARWRLETIQEQIGRISKIIQSLLNMARPKATERVPVALEPLLENTLAFLSEKLKRRQVDVVRSIEPVGSVTGDPERLQQLLLNLFMNAIDAMPGGGELQVALRPDGAAGALVEVGDTGVGIPPDDLDRIFDAFYTSKEAGKGNGLGLMVASRIVTDHGGTIEVESEVDRGTTFHIHLPWSPAYPKDHRGGAGSPPTVPH